MPVFGTFREPVSPLQMLIHWSLTSSLEREAGDYWHLVLNVRCLFPLIVLIHLCSRDSVLWIPCCFGPLASPGNPLNPLLLWSTNITWESPGSLAALVHQHHLLNVPGQKLGHPLLWSTKSNWGKTLQMPVRSFALEIQLVWPPEASMGHWLSLIRLICATWGPVPLAVKTSGFTTPPHFHCLCPPTWTWIHSSGTTHDTCL